MQAALAPSMAMRQLMADVRPEEEAALRALVQPVEPVEQPQDGVVLGYWPTAANIRAHQSDGSAGDVESVGVCSDWRSGRRSRSDAAGSHSIY